ncbi:MAG: glycosyltransferase family 9 protein [Nanoarchaeota archaeon]|nr:glycosyltransferase family 9 protein [Nanoarchaeota archaeon]
MHPDTMRRVDAWVGRPLCFLFSLLNSLQRALGIRRLPKGFKPKKMLFLELSEMGSTILGYGAMKRAKELFGAELYFLIFESNAESIRMLDVIPRKNILTIRSSNIFVMGWDTLKMIVRMRRLKIDTVVDMELFSRFTALLSYFSGAKAVSGFYKFYMEGLYRGNFLTHKVQYNPYYHISQSFLALVYALAADPCELPLLKREVRKEEVIRGRIHSTEEQKKAMLKKVQGFNASITSKSKLVLLNPNASELLPLRKWPLSHYQKLAEKLLTLKDTYLVITGVASEKPDAQAICEYVHSDRCIDFTGQTTLRELIDLYEVSSLLISNDSGPAHFASLTDIPIIVFFGPETPALYGPLSPHCTPVYANLACSPCVSAFNHRKSACSNNRCLQVITPERVFELVKEKI